MKSKIFLLAGAFTATFLASSFDKSCVVISLGENCSTAGMLRHLGIRQEAYPFDWLISPFKAVYNTLLYDFNNFLNLDNLAIDPNLPFFVVDTKWGFKFGHDFPFLGNYMRDEIEEVLSEGKIIVPDFKKYIVEIKNKYDRRIARFLNLLNSSKKVILIRSFSSPFYNAWAGVKTVGQASLRQQAIVLKNILKKKFPGLEFLLVCIGCYPELISPWNLDNIKNYWIPNEDTTYNINTNFYQSWLKIVKELELV